jgi:serine protease Do
MQPITKDLVEHGKVVRGWLGVVIQDIDRKLAEAMKLPSRDGVLVADVQSASPAASAGLLRGDVILSIDGAPVDDSAKLKNSVAAAGANAMIRVEILRGGRKQTLTVKLNEMPAEAIARDPRASRPVPAPSDTLGGLLLEALTPELAVHLGLPPNVRAGLVVTEVVAQSPAERAGLRAGDVVLELDREKVATIADFERLWKAAQGETLLLVARGGRTLFLTVER